ncbi:Aluminum-activated malate transporter [Arabidopsis thaliana x Arabidopsis arenosa]|uniref:Aluminum-activated malate transporter 10 n=2 Tax=Arabidopsis TaxID=3701 RepID=ALMTA_ARATH|nr:RecName: Full=Aluminum-activated malate transporter 10; Short=AtALMT10 [Arabidopsis thaliana]KAG7614695.1 Aluminum-activated malate transporter [Arabidopsis thaliana x Arabidopsis arenosa]
MATQEAGKLEWRISVDNGTTERLVPRSGLSKRIFLWLKDLVMKVIMERVAKFMRKAWRIGADDPAKVVHCLKVGLALSLVSIFYYMRPLYDGVGGNAMWAIMTVVVVFESNVGATFCKCVNRVVATILAGSLGIAVHWVATQSGKAEVFVIGCSVFLFAFAATYSRFVPSFKARFDYGAMIFILTFSLVSVGGYRVDKLVELAQQRVSTIAIGTSICIIITVFFCPIWAGSQLHRLIERNLEKLADSLDGCVAEYFKENEVSTNRNEDENTNMKLQGFKCVLNSKGTEEAMPLIRFSGFSFSQANLARWEPAHGSFNFRHPWKLYVKIGAAMRRCAYCLENLSICINYETEAPDQVKNHFGEACMKLSSASSKILRELADMMKNTRKSSKMDFLVFDMNSAVQELQETLKNVPIETNKPEEVPSEEENKVDSEERTTSMSLHEVLPVATLVSLLIENAARIQTAVEAVDELANLADFEQDSKKKTGDNNTKQPPLSS